MVIGEKRGASRKTLICRTLVPEVRQFPQLWMFMRRPCRETREQGHFSTIFGRFLRGLNPNPLS